MGRAAPPACAKDIGPLAQTMAGYGGIWRDFLANPMLSPILEHALFAPQHDDHDYGVQDVNSTNLVPWGIARATRTMAGVRVFLAGTRFDGRLVSGRPES